MQLKSGEPVIDRANSHAKSMHLLPDALNNIESKGREFFIEEVDFGQPIGETTCVTTGDGDHVVYAFRPKRFGRTRFVMNRSQQPSSKFVVILKKGYEGEYILITSFIGSKPQPEPWDTKNFSQQPDPQLAERLSRKFWSTHALVWGSEQIIPGTEMEICPW